MPKSLVRPAPQRKPERQLLERNQQRNAWLLLAVLISLALLVYFDSLSMIAGSWRNAQYSHGFLVPLFAIGLLWWQRQYFRQVTAQERWCGVGLIALAIVVRIVSAYYTSFTPDNISLIPCLLGVFLLVGGWRSLKWSALPIAFLVFMYPWPDFAERLILVQLKRFVAMPVSLFVLQTLGVECYLAGNIIELGDGTKMNVVDACAGLSMLNLFLALAAGIAMVVPGRPLWERIAIFCCALPIALIVNPLRITMEGLLYYYGPGVMGAAWAVWLAQTFHEHLAPWFMMLLALGLLYLAYEFLQRLFVEDERSGALPKPAVLLPSTTKSRA